MSSIRSLNKNESIRIFYRSSSSTLNLDVRFNFLRLSGVSIFGEQLADGEVPNKGIYYYDFTAPNEDVYLVGLSYIGNKIDVEPIVFKVGNPFPQALFYYTEKEFSSPPSYRVYDTYGSEEQIGILASVPETGFWYTNFTPRNSTSDSYYIFEVSDEFTAKGFSPSLVSQTILVSNLSANILSPNVFAGSTQTSSTFESTISQISPYVSGDANVVVSVFEASVSESKISNYTNTVDVFVPSTVFVQPVVSADAIVSVSVFESATSLPENTIEAAIVSGVLEVIQPSILTDSDITNVVISGNVTLNQPHVFAEKRVKNKQGYPYDAGASLGVAPGIAAFGVASGRRRYSISLWFKVSSKSRNFESRENIYDKVPRYDLSVSLKEFKRRKKRRLNLNLNALESRGRSDLLLKLKEFKKVEYVN